MPDKGSLPARAETRFSVAPVGLGRLEPGPARGRGGPDLKYDVWVHSCCINALRLCKRRYRYPRVGRNLAIHDTSGGSSACTLVQLQ